MKNIIFADMTENEVKEALKTLNILIKNKTIVYDESHADPRLENCYISSGAVPGVWFPNSIITSVKTPDKAFYNHLKLYNFCCISKDAETKKIGVVMELKDDEKEKSPFLKKYLKEYDFINFKDLLYTWDEQRLIEALEKEIKALENDLTVLKALKFQTKKDGKPFADITKNFVYNPSDNIFINVSYNYSDYLNIYYTDNKNNNFSIHYDITLYNDESIETLKDEIKNRIENNNKTIEKYKNDIKNIKKIFKVVYTFKSDLRKNASGRSESIILNDLLKYVFL